METGQGAQRHGEWELPLELKLTRELQVELDQLQTQLVALQGRIRTTGSRLVVIFEGRDTAGKGGAIMRFRRYLDPRRARVLALPPPSERERGEWYFQRYVPHLPTRGEILFMDRSWYNRAIVEPVLGFCTDEQYTRFMRAVPAFEEMLIDDGIELVKLWFSIDKRTQASRLQARATDPRRQWKLSPVDGLAQERFAEVTRYKDAMFARTHSERSPWVIVDGRDRLRARMEAMRYVLIRCGATSTIEGLRIQPDPSVVAEYGRAGSPPA